MAETNEHVHDQVDDYLHGLLARQEAERIEQHCEGCPPCREALAQARQRLALLRSLPPIEASGQLVETTLARAHGHDRQRRRRVRRIFWGTLAGLAACVVVLAGAHLYYHRLKATPYDLFVLGQRELLASSAGSLRIRLINRATESAMSGVPVRVELRGPGQKQELASFTTDNLGGGQPRFRLPDWADGEYELYIVAQTPGSPEELSQSVRLKRSWKLMLTSDKPVYQPGQVIHLRTLGLRQPDLLPVAEQPTVFTVSDPKGNVLFKQTGQTSRFGIAAADCPLDSEILEGAYTIACKVADTESRLTVEVKKYVLPKFKVEVKPDRPFYRPGEKMTCTVRADYFFGKPVADAPVTVEVRAPNHGPLGNGKLTGRTDADGAVTLDYTIPANLPSETRISFQATVTDSGGQKQSASVSRPVTKDAVRIEVIPEGGTLVQQVPNVVYVLLTRADGLPLSARVTVSEMDETVQTDRQGLASFEYVPRSVNTTWTLKAVDAGGTVLDQRQVFLACGQVPRDFLVRTDQAVYEAGDTMRLTVEGSGTEPVFVDVLKDGQTLLSQTIEVADGRGSLSFDLPPDLFGTLQLCAYRFGDDGQAVSKTRILFVQPPGKLRVTAALDRAEYRPGGKAKLSLALTDAQGTACPGAVSLAGVDEAVFSVLAERPGMEQTFYTLDQELLQPVYALYPWSPNSDRPRTPEQQRLEAALFATTGRTALSPQSAPSAHHSLAVGSIEEKREHVTQQRRDGLHHVYLGWVGLILAVLALGYASLWCFLRPADVLKIHLGAGLVLAPMLLLSLTVFFSSTKHAASLSEVFDFDNVQVEKSAAGEGRFMAEEPKAEPDLTNSDIGIDNSGPPGQAGGSGRPAPRVRRIFPETMLWKPQVITDEQGRASVDIDLPDSITTWRLGASAVTADGRLGATHLPLKVFQPFFIDLNLPVALTRGDEVSVPVVVYNYLDKRQTVSLALKSADWFVLTGPAEQKVELAPREVRSLSYRLRVAKVGKHKLHVDGRSASSADALERVIEVVPDGRRIERVVNGTLRQPAKLTLDVPDNAIEGSASALVKIYPSSFSQLVEGLDNIFQMPNGCFEQTSSTTYPDILALDYLRRTGRSVPAVEAKARQYIHLGYQRLVGFEVPGGGFDWFGRPPANRTLTAYGLMEFSDMARVHDVDPQLIERTRNWLLDRRKRDGAWEPESHLMHDNALGSGQDDRLATTAYIAWAVFDHGAASGQAAPTRTYLLSRPPRGIKDPHVLALVCNALLAIDPQGDSAGPYLDRLAELKRSSADGQQVWWEQPAGERTTFYGSGHSGGIETTALAALALIGGQRHPEAARGALAWLVAQKDSRGTWHSTQATVLSLKALLAGTGRPLGGDGERRIEVRLGETFRQEIVIPADQAEVLRQLDLSPHLLAGTQKLTVTEASGTGAGFQVTFRYHVAEAKQPEKDPGPLEVALGYDRTELAVGDTVQATARVVNRTKTTAPMVMLELPVPAGFAPQAEDFAALANAGTIARFQIEPRRVLLYLRGLAPDRPLEAAYRLKATMPVQTAAPGARAYEYYDPDREGHTPGTRLTVKARK